MLVLSRKKNETIVIDGQIKIEVLKIKGNTIRLGITAPRSVKVLRGELAPFGIAPPVEEDKCETDSKDELPTENMFEIEIPSDFQIAQAS